MYWSAPMNRNVRRLVTTASAALLAIAGSGLGVSAVMAQAAAALAVPAPPAEEELHANADSSITITWPASPGATSYNIYRGTSAGGEGTTPLASTTATTYTDKNLSPTPIYFYQITAVNAAGESARTDEDASKTPPPLSTGGGVAGTPAGNSLVYYCEDARLSGFDWFQRLTGWFPETLGSSAASSPGGRVVDMAYADEGAMTFNNVVVPTTGLYTVDWRYAYQGGLFPGVNNRRMGLSVNGTVVTTTQSFPITGSFETYKHSFLQVHLNAGVNSISQLAVSDHGLSRVDTMTVTPATASVPSGPTNLTSSATAGAVTLHWTASTTGSPTSYQIFRGTKSDGEAVAAVGTTNGTTTAFADTGGKSGTTYYYFVQAVNAVGGSPTSNEISVVAGASDTTAPSTPTNLVAAGTTSTSTNLTWTASTDNIGVAGYDVVRGGTTVATVTGTSYAATGLTPSTAYTFQVKARDAAGNLSAASNTVTVTTLASGGGGGANLALGRPTTASSIEGASTAAAKATDGDTTTRWSSAFSDPQWIQVDLGAVHAVNQVVIQWQNSHATAYQVQVSNDSTTWTTIYSTTTSTGGTETLNVAGSGRYLRVYGTARSTGYGYSIWELQVLGS
jgi:fibronectin type 3 domain-containing protein